MESFFRWSRNDQPLPITDASFGDMESIKKVTYICNISVVLVGVTSFSYSYSMPGFSNF